MADRDLVNYISSNLRRGVSFDDIQAALLARGHSDYDITEAVNFINGGGNRSKIQSANIPRGHQTVGHGVKFFFLGFFSLVVLIVIVLLLAPAIRDSNKNVVTISEGSLRVGESFDLTKNNLISFEMAGEKNDFTVKAKGSELIFSGSSGFVMEPGEVRDLDVNMDGKDDYSISYSPLKDKRIFIEAICIEDWSCDSWDNCFLGTRKRGCVDLNSCGTTSLRPLLVENCDDADSVDYTKVELPVVEDNSEVVEDNLDNSDEVVVTPHVFLSCGSGVEDDSSKFCTGEKEIVKNSTDSLVCCMGDLVFKLELSDSLRSVWTSTESSGVCTGELFDSLHECSVHKCLSENGIYYRGVLGPIGVTQQDCAYIEEVAGGELYCEYNQNDRANVVGYYFSESLADEVVHNSSGTFLDGKLTRNYPQEAIDSGICQVI